MLTTRYNNVVLLITMKKYSQQISKIFFTTAILFLVSIYSNKALAAPLENKSDSMSRLGSSTAADVPSDHTIQFVTPTGVASTETIVVTFPADFDGSSHPNGALDYTDVDFLVGGTNCSGTPQTLVASAPGASEWSAEFSGTENRVLTITAGASAVVNPGSAVCIKIGQNATGGTANSQYINPTTTGAKTISLEAGVDTGEIVVSIIANDVVVITARVNETITFSLSDYEVGFGVLDTANARFATGTEPYGATGPTATAAHTMTVATNGSSGYDLTYRGATLTSGSNAIDPATITTTTDGNPGTEQFAISFSTSDNATIVPAYLQTDHYSFVQNTETQFAYETAPTANETLTAFYLANISGLTPAGTYSTAITYVASANF